MKKIKILYGSLRTLEIECNEWLEKNPNIEIIKINNNASNDYYWIMILYEEKVIDSRNCSNSLFNPLQT